jgi:hypothetical protein
MDRRTLRDIGMLGGDLVALWAEAASVVCLRSMKLAKGGPKARVEAGLMVREKIAAHRELVALLHAGKLGNNPLAASAEVTRYLLRGVRANRRRLSRG